MELDQIRENGARVLLRFSAPAIATMLLTALVTIADGFFIGNYVGKDGIAAVNLGLPIIYLYLGVGLMVSVGGMAIAQNAMGAGKREICNQVFMQTIVTAMVFSAVVSGVMVCCFEPILSVLRADGEVKAYFQGYYRIMLLQLPVMVLNSTFGMFIRGDGNPQYYMKVSMGNVLLNIFLDWLFVDRLGAGVAGIALASLLSTLICLGPVLYYFMKKARTYRFCAFRFSGKVCLRSVLNGSSEFIGEMSTGIAMFAYNFVIMRKIGADGVTAFTIVGYVAFAFNMVVTGFGQGACPLIGFCRGAGEKALAVGIRKRANRYVFWAGAIVFVIMAAASDWYGGAFVRNANIKEMVRSGIWIFMVSFFFMGINAITSFYFTAIQKAFASAVISFLRGLFLLLLCIFVLPMLFGMTGVWLAAPVTEGITLLVTLFFLWKEKMEERLLAHR